MMAVGAVDAVKAVRAEATLGSAAQWHRTEAHLLKVLVSLCKSLAKACKASINSELATF